jgi:hypothetical protein
MVQRPLGLALELRQVLGVALGGQGVGALVRREPGIVGADDVIGHAEHVETAAAVEVDDLVDGQCAVAPGGVCVQLGKQRCDPRPHPT